MKILTLLSAVVIAAISFYLFLASKIFYEDKTLLIYELNQTNVRTLGAEVTAHLQKILDNLRIFAAYPQALHDAVFEKDSDLVSVGRVRRNSSGNAPKVEILRVWPGYLLLHSKDASYLTELHEKFPIPFDRVTSKGPWIRNTSLPGADPNDRPALMTVAMPFLDSQGASQVIFADVRMDRIVENFPKDGLAKMVLVDSEGFTLGHSSPDEVVGAKQLSSDPLVSLALGSKLRSGVQRFEEGEQAFLGSYYKIGIGDLVVASKIELEQAFTAARLLIRKSLLYAVVIVSTAFLIALFFSHSITAPIRQMVDATHRIAQGDFNRVVSISSRDELALLAVSFNSMTRDLKHSRAEIEGYSRDLETKVADRTAKLEAQNVAIKEAQEALVRTTRLASVGEIAGRAAHEVLNPLTNISARLEKIKSQRLEEENQDLQLLEEIVSAWSKTLREKGKASLIEDLALPSSTKPGATMLEEDLANLLEIRKDLGAGVSHWRSDLDFLLKECNRISKIVNGMRQLTRVSGNRSVIDLHLFLDEAVSGMTDLFSKHSIRIEKQFCKDSPQIFAAHDEMLQVFNNLFRNSLQAFQELGVALRDTKMSAKLWVSSEVRGDQISVRISDNGPGILPENVQKIFEPSFTTKGLEDGTGLGLSIARRFVRAYGGELTLEKSIPGVETCFRMDLPVSLPAQGNVKWNQANG